MLTPSQVQEIKKQIISQIESSFPENKKQIAISQIQSMSPEELEQFLIQNKLIRDSQEESLENHLQKTDSKKEQNQEQNIQNHCVFCSIIQGHIQSHKIAENKDALAVLEINPVSRGHALIIPKKHLRSASDLNQQVFALSKKVAKKLKSKLKPKDITITSLSLLGHTIINVLPVYKDETIYSQKIPISESNLKELQVLLKEKEKSKEKTEEYKPKKKSNKGKTEEKQVKDQIKLPHRIP